MNARNVGPALVAVASVLVLLGTLVGGAAGAALLALAVPAVPASLAVVAAGRRPRAIVAIVFLAVGCQALLLAIAFGGASIAVRYAGLPASSWLALLGLGVVPLIGVPLLYAAGFAGREDGRG